MRILSQVFEKIGNLKPARVSEADQLAEINAKVLRISGEYFPVAAALGNKGNGPRPFRFYAPTAEFAGRYVKTHTVWPDNTQIAPLYDLFDLFFKNFSLFFSGFAKT